MKYRCLPMKKYLLTFLLLNVCSLTASVFRQGADIVGLAGRERYQDIDLYYGWREEEACDSVYSRAYQNFDNCIIHSKSLYIQI